MNVLAGKEGNAFVNTCKLWYNFRNSE